MEVSHDEEGQSPSWKCLLFWPFLPTLVSLLLHNSLGVDVVNPLNWLLFEALLIL